MKAKFFPHWRWFVNFAIKLIRNELAQIAHRFTTWLGQEICACGGFKPSAKDE